MRLSERESAVITSTIRKRFGPDCRILPFGSRVDDAKRGGDIDLLVESPLPDVQAFKARIDAMSEIQITLGERKIDLIVTDPERRDSRTVVGIATDQGVEL